MFVVKRMMDPAEWARLSSAPVLLSDAAIAVGHITEGSPRVFVKVAQGPTSSGSTVGEKTVWLLPVFLTREEADAWSGGRDDVVEIDDPKDWSSVR